MSIPYCVEYDYHIGAFIFQFELLIELIFYAKSSPKYFRKSRGSQLVKLNQIQNISNYKVISSFSNNLLLQLSIIIFGHISDQIIIYLINYCIHYLLEVVSCLTEVQLSLQNRSLVKKIQFYSLIWQPFKDMCPVFEGLKL